MTSTSQNADIDLESQPLKDKNQKDKNPSTSSHNHPTSSLIDDQAIRKGFVRKVYGILCVQLAITVLACIAAIYYQPLGHFMASNWIVLILVAVFAIAFLITLSCFIEVARSTPWNYIILILFTLTMSYLVAATCAVYEEAGMGNLVLWAAISTFALVAALTAYAWTTDSDITMWGGVLFCCCIGLTLFMIMDWFIGSSLIYTILCAVAVVLFGIYLVYDTQLLMGNKKYALSEDDYILGALALYLDVIMIFVYLLELMGLAKS